MEARGVSETDWVARSGARAKGRRPRYFDDPTTERTLSIVLALAAEVSALRERLDTVERLLEDKGTISRADIETYAPDRHAGEERGVATKAFVARVMRVVQQEVEAMQASDRSIPEWVEDLSKS
jgi:hypothetical protein